jgi:hypothetical protein
VEVLTEEQLAGRIDYRRPMKDVPDERESLWCIPFPYGSNHRETKISIALAKTISAQLRADVAEAEQRELKRYFDRQTKRAEEMGRQCSDEQKKVFALQGEVADLKRRLRNRGKK